MQANLKIKKSNKFTARKKINKTFVYLMLIIIGVAMLTPLIVLFATSFKTYDELIMSPNTLLPKKLSLQSFVFVFKNYPYFKYLLNTVFITVITIVSTCLSSALVAYGFVRFKVKGSKLLFGLFISGMLIPGQILIIPMFELYDKLGWIDTFLPFIIPPIFGGGIFNVFLQRQFMRGLGKEIFESAEIEGASEIQIFFKIVLPMVKPVMVTIAIFTFINSWNDLFGPLIYLNDPNKWTLAKGTYMIFQDALGSLGSSGASILPWNILSAANILVSVPIIILYFFAQRQFIEGVKITGSKES